MKAPFVFSPFVRVLVVLLSIVGIAPNSSAIDSKIQRRVIDDCAGATQEISNLPDAELDALIHPLSQLLDLDLTSFHDLPQQLPPPGPRLPNLSSPSRVDPSRIDPSRMEIWRSFDPDLELNAKRCAIGLLRKLGARSVSALPRLIKAAVDLREADPLRNEIEEAVVDVAEKSAHLTTLAPQIVEELLTLSTEKNSVLPLDVLEIVGQPAIPGLVTSYLNRNEEQGRAILELLLRIDPAATALSPAVFAQSEENGAFLPAALRLFSRLPNGAPAPQGELLLEIAEGADAGSANNAVVILSRELSGELVPRFCPARLSCNGSDEQIVRKMLPLLKKVDLDVAPLFPVVATRLEGAKSGAENVLSLLVAEDPLLRLRGLGIVRHSVTLRERTYASVKKLLRDPSREVRREAARVLAQTKSRRGETEEALIASLNRIIKDGPSGGFPDELPALLDLLSTLGPRRSISNISAAIDAVLTSEHDLSVEEIVAMLDRLGPAVDLLVQKQLASPKVEVRRRAARLLAQPGHRAVALMAVLNDPDPTVASEAIIGLQREIAQSEPLLSRAVRNGDDKALNAAAVLVLSGKRLPTEAQKLVPQLENRDCEVRRGLAERALAGDIAPTENFLPLLLQCTEVYPEEVARIVEKGVLSSAERAASVTVELLTTKSTPERVRLALVSLVGILPVNRTELGDRLITELRTEPTIVTIELLAKLALSGDQAENFEEELQSNFADDDDLSKGIGCASLAALATLNGDQFDWGRYLRKQIGDHRLLGVIQCLAYQLTPGRTLLNRAAQREALEALSPFLRSRNGLLQCATTMALLRGSQASSAELVQATRYALFGRCGREIALSPLGEGGMSALREIAQSPQNALQRRIATQALKDNEARG